MTVLLYIQPQRLNASHNVALIIRHAASVENAIPDGRLERFGVPEIQGFRWLHVVVTIREQCPVSSPKLRVHDRMAVSLHQASLGSSFFQLAAHPFGALAKVAGIILVRRDGWHPQELRELLQKVFSMSVHTIFHLHR
jgi:hypothetical protein